MNPIQARIQEIKAIKEERGHNDSNYQGYELDILQCFEDYDIESLGDYLHEIAESFVDIYYHDIIQWAKDHGDFHTTITEEHLGMSIYKVFQYQQFEYFSDLIHECFDDLENDIKEYLEQELESEEE